METSDTALLHEAAVSVVRKYMDSFYRSRQERWRGLLFRRIRL